MAIQIYTCERCGKEKEIDLEPGQKLEDNICSCRTNSNKSDGSYIGLGTNKYHEHGTCGCGGSCGSN